MPAVTAASGSAPTVDPRHAVDAAQAVLASLKSHPVAPAVAVPTAVLEKLAAAVIELAGAVGGTPPAPPARKMAARFVLKSGFSHDAGARADLEPKASRLRVVAADLGLPIAIGLKNENMFGPFVLVIEGEGPKDLLDRLKQEAQALVGFGGRFDVAKYDMA